MLELRLAFQRPLSPDDEAGWRDVLKTFVDVAQCGALSGSGIAPARSGCVVECEALAEDQAVLVLRQVALDAGASTVLLNLCHWGHLNVSPLREVVVCWERCPQEAQAPAPPFPGAWMPPSFGLQQYELVGQIIAIDIEFLQPQAPDAREQINDLIGHWFKAANWGGYANDQFPLPGSTIVIAPEPMTADALGISWYLESYLCSDSVFDGLTNCLERISSTQAPIGHVSIGE